MEYRRFRAVVENEHSDSLRHLKKPIITSLVLMSHRADLIEVPNVCHKPRCLAVAAELVTRYDSILSVTWILGSSIAGNILAVQPEHCEATVVACQHRRTE